ncbi:hypothetical protein VCHENC01_1773A, partial [Vibrio harveyi]
MRLNN